MRISFSVLLMVCLLFSAIASANLPEAKAQAPVYQQPQQNGNPDESNLTDDSDLPSGTDDLQGSFVYAIDQHHLNPDYTFYYDIGPIQSKDNWAWVYAVERDKVSNEINSGEPRLLLGKFVNGSWNVVLPEFGDLYNQLIDEIPETIIDPVIKAMNRVQSAPDMSISATFSGYNLPWPSGKYSYVSQNPSKHGTGRVDFTFQFNEPRDVLAAKSGWIIYANDSHTVTNRYSTCDYWYNNAVVIKHATGEYSAYLHLKNNSIPSSIKDKCSNGATGGTCSVWVEKGTKIGEEGTTGCSTGLHLHFEVGTGYYTKCYADNMDEDKDGNTSELSACTGGIPGVPDYHATFDTNEISYSSLSDYSNGVALYSQNVGVGQNYCSAPSLISPADGFQSTSNTVSFAWNHPNNCSGQNGFYVRVGTSAGGSNVISNYYIPGISGNITIGQYLNQDLYWSVAANAPGAVWSKSRRFRIIGNGPTPTSQPTLNPTGWNEYYYSDNNLGSQCASKGGESSIYMFRDSDAGWAPPSGCPSAESAWSVRMENGSVPFTGGNYEFGLFYDDGAKVYLDGNVIVDGWNATQHYETHYVSPGNHSMRVDYKNNAGHAIVQLWWRGPGALPGINETQDPYQWWANYWGNQTQWQDSVGRRNEGTGFLNHDWGNGSPGYNLPTDHFSTRYVRTVNFNCGTYRFHLKSDDGSKLWIDDVLKMDNWSTNTWDKTLDVSLTTGDHKIQVDQFENGGGANVYLDWTLLSTCPVPTAPNLISPSTDQVFGSQDSITLNWSATGEQYYGEVWGGPGGTQTFGWQTGTSKDLGTLTGGYTYYWHIQAKNSVGTSSWSETRSFVVNPACYTLMLACSFNGGSIPIPSPTKSSTCTSNYTYTSGEVIKLTATPSTGYRVGGWSGVGIKSTESTTNTLIMPAANSGVVVMYVDTPSKPAIYSPMNVAQLSTLTPKLDWGSSRLPVGTSFYYYQVQLARTSSFTTPDFDKNVSYNTPVNHYFNVGTEGTSSLRTATRYYWRVRTILTNGKVGPWSQIGVFLTPVRKPTLSSPANHANLSGSSATLVWGAVPVSSGTISYTLQYGKDSTFTTTTTVNLTGTSKVISIPSTGRYYWRVRANSSGFGQSTWSTVYDFYFTKK